MAVTYHLANALPVEVLSQWRQELAHFLVDAREVETRQRIETYLDATPGEAWLARPDIATIVENCLLHDEAKRYRLHAWVVMPNHVHVLFTTQAGHSMSSVIQQWKSVSAHRALRLLHPMDGFWQGDYYDRHIRNESHFASAVQYIENNPVKAGLCRSPEQWRFSSARRRHRDSLETGGGSADGV